MNPNSANQIWSRWKWEVSVRRSLWTFQEVRVNCARFARQPQIFGLATQMRVCEKRGQRGRMFVVDVRSEGRPAHDPDFKAAMLAAWDKFFRRGFGQDARIKSWVRVEAGSLQDGSPAQQLVIVPPLAVPAELAEHFRAGPLSVFVKPEPKEA